MDAVRWDRIQAIFHEAVERPPADRQAFLDAACAGDEALLTEVRELLDSDVDGLSVLDLGVAHVADRVLDEPSSTSVPSARVGRYVVTSRLGEGGMGVVYLAEREDLGSRVAIKVLRDAWVSPARRDRFASEERTLARLNHPAIARIYDADTLPDGTPWFAMEYVDGVPITEFCDRHVPAIGERLTLFRKVCEAVQHAHQQLIVHRDLKPSNILVTSDGAVKLLDFGIAKQLESLDRPAEHTRAALRFMTPAYAAPEQIRGEPSGVQSDVYALGVILYELLTGGRPFDLSDRTPAEAEMLVLQGEPAAPSVASRGSQLAKSASRASWADLDILCLTAMHKDPRRRYATVEALVRDIDHFERREPLEARPDSLAYRADRFLRRNWRGLSAASIVLALLVGLVAFYTARLATARGAAVAEAARTHRVERFMLSLFEGGAGDAGPAADLRVVSLLDRGVQEARSLDADPAIQAELYQTLGRIYRNLGSYEEADRLLGTALDQRRARYGAGHPDVVDSLVALGLLRVDQARLDEAERLVGEGLASGRRTLPPNHPSLVGAIAALGRVHRERGKYDDAARLLDEAIRAYSASPSNAHELAAALTSLANTHFYAGRLDESDDLNHRVLEMDRRLYGDRHPNVAHTQLNLGAIRSSRGQHADAERYYRDARDILESWYGAHHPETASAQTILSQALVQQGMYDEAIQLLRQALATQERIHGPVHPRVAFVWNELGIAALRRNALDEAAIALGRALEVYRAIDGGKHFRVGVALANLASVHLAQEDYARAESLFREALALYGDVLPPEHLNTAIARSKLGRVLVRQQRYQEAEAELLVAHDILSRQKTPASSWLQTTREDLVASYDALGQREKAQRFRAELAEAQGAIP
jgi:serine/threonine-protein kinase